VTQPATFVDADHDEIRIDNRLIPDPPPMVYFVLYKPKGYITGRDDDRGRKTVHDLLERLDERVESIGRLDYDTEGVLLLTNDGDLAHRLLHPSRKVPKRYMVKCYRTPSDKDLDAIRKGIYLDDGKTQPAMCRISDTTDSQNAWVEITVTEGRNRLIRRIFAKLGHPVSKLRRESFGTIS
jgi:pseudouridine synthase